MKNLGTWELIWTAERSVRFAPLWLIDSRQKGKRRETHRPRRSPNELPGRAVRDDRYAR